MLHISTRATWVKVHNQRLWVGERYSQGRVLYNTLTIFKLIFNLTPSSWPVLTVWLVFPAVLLLASHLFDLFATHERSQFLKRDWFILQPFWNKRNIFYSNWVFQNANFRNFLGSKNHKQWNQSPFHNVYDSIWR